MGLTEAERAVATSVLSWAASYERIREMPGRKLFRVITPQDEEQNYTPGDDRQVVEDNRCILNQAETVVC